MLRTSGAFNLQGFIQVGPHARSGGAYQTATGTGLALPAQAGIAGAPGWGEWGTSIAVAGGLGSKGLATPEARLVLLPGPFAGGANANMDNVAGSTGGQPSGGGSVVILAKGAITLGPTSQLNASGGGGGNAGGVIVLASKTSITIQGGAQLLASGANGSPSSVTRGAGGGGGGGLIHLLAPTITMAGSTNVSGGSAGSSAVAVVSPFRIGGGGGGSCGGSGGAGGSVAANGAAGAAGAGTAGYVFQEIVDPTALF